MPLKMRRVPQEAFLSTECVFRTVEGPLRYRMPQSQKGESHCWHRIPQTARKEETSAKSAARDAAASKKITAKKFAIPPQICSTPPGRADVAKIHSMPPQKKLLSAPGIFADCYKLSLPTPRGWVAKTYLYKRRTTATRDCRSSLERKTGLGPATSTLARLRSTN